MFRRKFQNRMWIFFILFMFGSISCSTEDPFFGKSSIKQLCINLCQEEKLPSIFPVGNLESVICQAGCSLFNIQFGGGLDVNPPLKRCHNGCGQSFYRAGEIDICHIGCERMASKVQNMIQSILVMTPQERIGKDLLFRETDTDVVETDLLSDPSIKSQLEVGFNVDYKIPETHIRTMPIEDKDQLTSVVHIKPKDTGDWLDCASKNSGIPKWILLSTMLGAIMVAIWLTLSMESRRGHEDCDDEMLVHIPDEKDMDNFVVEKDVMLLENDAFKVALEDDTVDVRFAPPPTYLEVNEVNHSDLPKYSEAIEGQKREENA